MLDAKIVQPQTNHFNISTQFRCQEQFYFKQIYLAQLGFCLHIDQCLNSSTSDVFPMLNAKTVQPQTNHFNISTQFRGQKQFYFKQIYLAQLEFCLLRVQCLNSSTSDVSPMLNAKRVQPQTNHSNISTQFRCQEQFYFKQIHLAQLEFYLHSILCLNSSTSNMQFIWKNNSISNISVWNKYTA